MAPTTEHFLAVSDGHQLHFQTRGKPNGKPVLFLHGGPGGGCSKKDQRFFNYKHLNVTFLDQRGSGKSTPYASTHANTTQHLVEDIDVLLDHQGIDQVFLFGGSWGSTLALCYAIANPDRVAGMLLRGIFFGNAPEIKYIFDGPAKHLFPNARARLYSLVPKDQHHRIAEYYYEQINSQNKAKALEYAFEWELYEQSLLKLEPNEKHTEKKMKVWNPLAIARLETHYFVNNCFLPNNYILNHIFSIEDIPLSIVHGRYDMICPPQSAVSLHEKHGKSKLFLTTAGHASSDPATEKRLKAEMESMRKKIKW
ncbi:MAG: prolyl aminopeptidase [Candidatus Diapherotrites archaeon]|uniref:Proline iminopeptidase n=1 Tax=Candidatus Iainarchaeum sp. TaxID=3101447 RepID=A0A8T4LE53_9ARCH|nr:prolyl aminopeptidase [Candidatus Diapherotrites archaeon]